MSSISSVVSIRITEKWRTCLWFVVDEGDIISGPIIVSGFAVCLRSVKAIEVE